MAISLTRRIVFLFFSAILATAGLALAADTMNPPLTNWSMPRTWSPHSASRGLSTQADISSAFVGIAITPCRQFDVRPGTLLDNTNLTITLTGAPCGIPADVPAVSVNITVFSITGATGNGVFQVGTALNPTFAWINYPPTEAQRGNAGIVPLDSTGHIVVKVNQGGGSIQLTVDVNGYFVDSGAVLNTGAGLNLQGNTAGALVSGTNASTAGGFTSGVAGALFTPGSAGSGVLGVQFASTGLNFGVAGLNASSTDGATGVFGLAAASTGATYGVQGSNSSGSGNSAGVLGFDGSGRPPTPVTFGSAGVRGESEANFGVLGITNFPAGFSAVAGHLMTTAGVNTAIGRLGANFGTATDATGPPWGVFSSGNLGALGVKHFVEPHPTDPRRVVLYSSLEGREVGTYFRGTARVVNHQAIIEIPEDFRMVTDDEGLTVQLTPVGDLATLAVISRDLNRIVVKASKDVTFDYLVHGVRRAFKDLEPIRIGYEFMPQSPEETMPAYLTEEAKRRLIANGTYNPDGTVNMSTAERAGWTKIWADRRAASEAAARAAAQQRALPSAFPWQ